MPKMLIWSLCFVLILMHAFLYQTIYIVAATDLRVPKIYFVQKTVTVLLCKVIKSVLGRKYINHGRVRDPMLKLSILSIPRNSSSGLRFKDASASHCGTFWHFNFESSISLAADSALIWRLRLKLGILNLRQVMLYICL